MFKKVHAPSLLTLELINKEHNIMLYLKKALICSVSAASNQLVIVQVSSRQEAEIVMWSTF